MSNAGSNSAWPTIAIPLLSQNEWRGFLKLVEEYQPSTDSPTRIRAEQTKAIIYTLKQLTDGQCDAFIKAVKGIPLKNGKYISRATLDRIKSGDAFTLQQDVLCAVMKSLQATLKALPLTPDQLGFSPAGGLRAFDIVLIPGCEFERNIVHTLGNGGKKNPHTFKALQEAGLTPWPQLVSNQDAQIFDPNPVLPTSGGRFRTDEVLVYARSSIIKHQQDALQSDPQKQSKPSLFSFREAGPAENVCFPLRGKKTLRIGVVVSGAIAPGINAVIDGICERHELYHSSAENPPDSEPKIPRQRYTLEIYGYREGFRGIVNAAGRKDRLIHAEESNIQAINTRHFADHAGSIIGTSRLRTLEQGEDPDQREQDLHKLLKRFAEDQMNIVYFIGGDGTMKAAHVLHKISTASAGRHPSIIGIPKSIDNDILFCTASLGFNGAVARATEFVRQLYNEISSNPRLCIVSLFGSSSGFLVSNTALACGVCDAALIPEVSYSLKSLSQHIIKKLDSRHDKARRPYGMILTAETAVPNDIDEYLKDPDSKLALDPTERDVIEQYLKLTNGGKAPFQGHTLPGLGGAVLKVITRYLKRDIQKKSHEDLIWESYGIFADEPGYLIRTVQPTGTDLILAHRLGTMAVDAAMAGVSDAMISHWNSEYVIVPLSLVVIGKKRVPGDGIFWRSVLASTEQPDQFFEPVSTNPIGCPTVVDRTF